MRKGQLLKYIKKKVLVGPKKESWCPKGLTIKVANEGTLKEAGTDRSAQNL